MVPEPYPGAENLEALEAAVNYNRFLADLASQAAGGAGSAVDFGAGQGGLAQELRRRGFDVVCVEPDAELRRRIAALGLPVRDSLAGLDPVDFVVCVNVLEHIEDDAGTLRQLYGKLRPGGRLLLYVPASPLLYSAMDRLVGHVRRYRRQQLVDTVESSGFVIVEARYADCLGFFAALLYKWMGGNQGRLSRRSVRFYDRIVFPLSRLLDRAGLAGVLGKNLVVIAARPGERGNPGAQPARTASAQSTKSAAESTTRAAARRRWRTR